MNLERIEALVFLAAAALLALQALAAWREKRAMRAAWPRLEGVISEARPVIVEGDDGPIHLLQLCVDTAEGQKRPRDLIAQSKLKLDGLAREHAVGSRVALVVDPKHGVLWIDGRTPDTYTNQLWVIALALAAVGIASWLGHLDFLLRHLGLPRP
jgi:hypothetical protein